MIQQAQALVVTITFDSVLQWNPGTPPVGIQGNPWSWLLPMPIGGNPPYTFSVTNGQTLPASFTLTPGGFLTGVPQSGSLAFYITVSDTAH